jgi:hypothetical protein
MGPDFHQERRFEIYLQAPYLRSQPKDGNIPENRMDIRAATHVG